MEKREREHKTRRALGVVWTALLFFFLAAGGLRGELLGGDDEDWCRPHLAAGSTGRGLGPQDLYAGYHGFVARVKEGERALFRAHFPHARYMSLVLYDQNFKVIDALTDYQLQPLRGSNPFVAGTDRHSADLGEFEVRVEMTPSPTGPRPANTLYAGLDVNGEANRIMVLGYRVYLADRGYGYGDGHPLAVFGGVPGPRFKMIDKNGRGYCPSRVEGRLLRFRLTAAIFRENKAMLFSPAGPLAQQGRLASPPVWSNPYSRAERQANTYVGNEDTAYLAAPVSGKFGELLVLRWRPPRTPEETWFGKPFPPPENLDMRYFSISFAYVDRSKDLFAYTERTVADIDAPALPDGTRQIVVGFGGRERPASVPPEQWVGLKMKEGILIARYILVNPQYQGDFGRLPPGPVGGGFDQYTPGGVYCSAAEFERNPDIGLSRWKQ